MNLNALGDIIIIIFSIFPLTVTAIDISDRIKHKNDNSVRVWFGLDIICCLGSFVGIFGCVSNCVYLIEEKRTDDIWFVVMMFVAYIVLSVILIEIHNERIIYPVNGDEVFISLNLHKEQIKIKEITRVYASDTYLDIYVGKRRIRYGNNFLVGDFEFESFVKHYNAN